MPWRAASAVLLWISGAWAEAPQSWVEISATVTRTKPGQTGTAALVTPILMNCPVGQECKLFVGKTSTDGSVDLDAIRIEVTPTLLDDGRIQLKVVSLGTELGERPGDAGGRPAPAKAEPRLRFHSALPADGLFSVAGVDNTRRWLRLGQCIDGWKLSGYEAANRTLLVTQGDQTLRLPMASASVGSVTDADGRRIEVVTLPPGGQAQLLGKDGSQLTLGARRVEPTRPR